MSGKPRFQPAGEQRKTRKKRERTGREWNSYRRALYFQRSTNLAALYPTAVKIAQFPWGGWCCPLMWFFFEIVSKNHRVDGRANYGIAIAHRERGSGACAHLTAAGRQMIQNTGGNWLSVEGGVGRGQSRGSVITNRADLRPV